MKILQNKDIDRAEWSALVQSILSGMRRKLLGENSLTR